MRRKAVRRKISRQSRQIISQEKFDLEFSQVVDDLGGLIWNFYRISGKSFQKMGREAHLCGQTLKNLANRKTKNPQFATVWNIARALNNISLIKPSVLEMYRGFNEKSKLSSTNNVIPMKRKRTAA